MNSEYARIRNEVDVLIENLLQWLFVISVKSVTRSEGGQTHEVQYQDSSCQ